MLTNPIWVIKTRMELQRGGAPSVALAASKAASSAVSGLGSGASAAAAATASSLSATAAASAAQASRAAVGGGASTAQTLGAMAGSATEGSARRVMLSPYSNMAHAVRQIARDEGIRGFYRGLAPSLLLVRTNLFSDFFDYSKMCCDSPSWHPYHLWQPQGTSNCSVNYSPKMQRLSN